MNNLNQTLKIELAETITKLYRRSGYGRVLRSEVDAVVFHYFLMEELKGNLDYFSIDKKMIFELSSKLKLSESKFKRLFEEDYAIYQENKPFSEDNDKSFFAHILSDLIQKHGITKKHLKDGKLYINVANPIVRKLLDVRLYESKGIMDTSFNSEKIIIDVYDFLNLFDYLNDKPIKKQLYNIIRSHVNKFEPDTQKFLNDIEGKTLPDFIKNITSAFFFKLLGKAGEEAVNYVYEVSYTAINFVIENSKEMMNNKN